MNKKLFGFIFLLSFILINGFTNTASAATPTITSISPMTGKVGDTITIIGTNFIGVSWILFNGAGNVPTTTNPSPTEITVRVPPGATNGKITIHTISNGDVSSATNFTVINTASPGVCSNGATNYPDCSIKTIRNDPLCANVSKKVEFKGLVPVCNTVVDSSGGYCDPCDFNMIMAVINKVITFLLVTLATPLFALIIIYVGWLYLSAGGSSENIGKAKKIFKNALIGYVIALAAWLIVKTILKAVEFKGDSFLS